MITHELPPPHEMLTAFLDRDVNYGDVARDVGRASAARAVARANGDNRIAIVIPCHRVVGWDGRLTGYGGGLWREQKLLDHERMHGGG